MRIGMLVSFFIVGLGSCSSSGPEACRAAGGECVIGGHACANRGPQDCNPDRNPGGAFCCLPCPSGTKANDAGTVCE
jgi:hypothetical protein